MSQSYPPPQPPPPPPPPGYGPPANGLAIAGMVVGIVSIALFWLTLFDLPVAIVGLILSIVGLTRSNQLGGTGRSMAVAGIVTSVIGFVAALVFLLAVAATYSPF